MHVQQLMNYSILYQVVCADSGIKYFMFLSSYYSETDALVVF